MAKKAPSILPLLADHAFVIQFQAAGEQAEIPRRGRIEHLVSGQAARFVCEEELWTFVESVLSEVVQNSAAEPEEPDR